MMWHYADTVHYPRVVCQSVRPSLAVDKRFTLYGGVDNLTNRKPPYGLLGNGSNGNGGDPTRERKDQWSRPWPALHQNSMARPSLGPRNQRERRPDPVSHLSGSISMPFTCAV